MTYVHEEPQLGIGHLLGMDMFLKLQVVALLAATVEQQQPYAQGSEQEVEYPRPHGGIPGRMNLEGELPHIGFLLVVDGLDAEAVCSGCHAVEGYLVDARLQTNPFASVDAVEVCYVFGVVVGEG